MSPSEFPYRAMTDDDQRRVSAAAAAEIKRLLDEIALAVVSIGRRLEQVEHELPERLFSAWLYSEFLWTDRIADGLLNAADVCGTPKQSCEWRPIIAQQLTRSLLSEGVAAQQLAKAQTLLAAYRVLLKGDPAFENLPRSWRRASLRESPVRSVRHRGHRRRRRAAREDEDTGE